MCGIAGFAGLPWDQATAATHLTRMCDAIRHRGPDGAGALVEPPVALGMRRLSIIDVEGGWQPIGNEDGSVQVVFNGEIYNFRPLRAELERLGHTFRTRSDTETIVHGYEEWGDDVLAHLRGMFAVAVWDRPRQRLLLARDRFGIKPLYLWPRDGGVAFASELKSLELLPDFPRIVASTALMQFLALGYVPDPLCIWEGLHKLAPGHLAIWMPGTPLVEHRWWSPLVAEQTHISEEEAIEELRRLLEDAVRCHLESDVPLGAFLSGGVDSSAVVAQMTRLAGDRVRTFSIGFEEAQYNEAPYAAQVASALGTAHTERHLTPDIDSLADELVLGFDEPFADSSALPTYLVAKLAREQVTVALSGDGGDELFGGYTRYQGVWNDSDASILGKAVARIARYLPRGAIGRGYLQNLGRGWTGRYTARVALPLLLDEGGVVRPEFANDDSQLASLFRNLFALTSGRDPLARMALVDVMGYLPGDILTKVDRMSMRVSLEARVPLLDHPFAEFALSLPSRLKIRDGVGKWVFREAIRPLVPRTVLERPKLGFTTPMEHWLRGPLRHRLEAMIHRDSGVFQWCDRQAVLRIVEDHLSGRRNRSGQVWRLLVLHTWLSAHTQ